MDLVDIVTRFLASDTFWVYAGKIGWALFGSWAAARFALVPLVKKGVRHLRRQPPAPPEPSSLFLSIASALTGDGGGFSVEPVSAALADGVWLRRRGNGTSDISIRFKEGTPEDYLIGKIDATDHLLQPELIQLGVLAKKALSDALALQVFVKKRAEPTCGGQISPAILAAQHSPNRPV